MKILLLPLWCLPLIGLAQQLPDTSFRPSFDRPYHALGSGPLVLIDAAHQNFHTLDGRYRSFANVLEADGYRVRANEQLFTAESLRRARVLVIANPLHTSNQNNWALPTPSAFTPEEIEAVRSWVAGGGRLFLIADHMPFAGAAHDLGAAFGFELINGFAMDNRRRTLEYFTRAGGALPANTITDGPGPADRIDSVITFTGSAFRAPEEALPILRLTAGYTILEPEVAWQFTETTPFRGGDGLLQLAALPYGRGRVVVSGEAAMFSAQLAGPQRAPFGMNLPEAVANVRLLRRIMQWLAE